MDNFNFRHYINLLESVSDSGSILMEADDDSSSSNDQYVRITHYLILDRDLMETLGSYEGSFIERLNPESFKIHTSKGVFVPDVNAVGLLKVNVTWYPKLEKDARKLAKDGKIIIIDGPKTEKIDPAHARSTKDVTYPDEKTAEKSYNPN